MKKQKTEKRVINIPKEDFDRIKQYCDENSLDMTKWVLNNSLEKIKNHLLNSLGYKMISASEVKTMFENALRVNIPENWKSTVMEEISIGIKNSVIHGSLSNNKNGYLWTPNIQVENVYGCNSYLSLSDFQINEIIDELTLFGYTVKKSEYCDSLGLPLKYIITW